MTKTNKMSLDYILNTPPKSRSSAAKKIQSNYRKHMNNKRTKRQKQMTAARYFLTEDLVDDNLSNLILRSVRGKKKSQKKSRKPKRSNRKSKRSNRKPKKTLKKRRRNRK